MNKAKNVRNQAIKYTHLKTSSKVTTNKGELFSSLTRADKETLKTSIN